MGFKKGFAARREFRWLKRKSPYGAPRLFRMLMS